MNDAQICISIFFTPLVMIFCIYEIRQGYKLLVLKQDAPSSIYPFRFYVYRIIFGKDYAEQYKQQYLNDKGGLKITAFTSIIGGIIFICLYIWYLILVFS
jgi:hypothetical protein